MAINIPPLPCHSQNCNTERVKSRDHQYSILRDYMSIMRRKSLRKSGSFFLKRSPSMEPVSPAAAAAAAAANISDHYSTNTTPRIAARKPRYYSSVQNPMNISSDYYHEPKVQPSAGQNQTQLHFSHPQHPLAKVSSPYLYTCLGCKEYGAGVALSCQHCTDFQLHDFCAFAPPTLNSHSLHPQHQLVFHSKTVKSGILWPKCDICNKAIKGFAYRCSSCAFMMHPCCSLLSTEMTVYAHPHPLRLLPATGLMASSGGDSGFACAHCEKKRSGRMYRCTCCDYHLHPFCAKTMFNGLQANGIEAPEKASMLGAAAKIASHVVIGFIGGLIEGIGEGVGEVLIQSIAKARRWNSKSE